MSTRFPVPLPPLSSPATLIFGRRRVFVSIEWMDALSFFNVAEGDTAARPAVPTLLFAPPPAAVSFYLPRSPPRLSLVRLAVSGTLNWPLRLSWSAAGKKTADAFVSEGSERMGDVRDSAAETSWRNRASSLLHIGYLWSEKKAGGGGNGDSGESGGVGEDGAERRRCECCGADQKNGFCEDWEGGEVEKFDGSTFPRYLKRVSLEERSCMRRCRIWVIWPTPSATLR